MRKGPGNVYDKWNIIMHGHLWHRRQKFYNSHQPSHGGDHKVCFKTVKWSWYTCEMITDNRGHCVYDHMVVGFIATYAISVYHH
jgi:hypothetical protein